MVKNFHRNREGKKMNPAIITAIGSVVGRLIDKTKPLGVTNLTTAGGTGVIAVGYLLFQEGEKIGQPIIEYSGIVVIIIGALTALVKEYKDET